MTNWKFSVVSAALILSGTFSAWAIARSPNVGNPDDGRINAEVREAIAQHRDLGAPNQIYVQSRDHVVFLSGWVYSGLSGDNAIEIARKVPGVTRVVSTIGVDEEEGGKVRGSLQGPAKDHDFLFTHYAPTP
jgi:hypothetical protein